jgi:hypothetical protein
MCVYLLFSDVNSGLSLENMAVCSQFVCTYYFFLHAWTDHIVLSVVPKPISQLVSGGSILSALISGWICEFTVLL